MKNLKYLAKIWGASVEDMCHLFHKIWIFIFKTVSEALPTDKNNSNNSDHGDTNNIRQSMIA